MQNLYFDDPFPLINIPVYTGKESIIEEECRVIDCLFENHENGPVINATNSIRRFHVDGASFIHCYGNGNGGAICIATAERSLVVICRSCASDCQCGENMMGNFVLITLGHQDSNGKVVFQMNSVSQCQKEKMNSFSSIIFQYGIQVISNLNHTNCKNYRDSGFINNRCIYGYAEYCNLVGNVMKETLLIYSFYYSIYKYLNIIKNKCSSLGNPYYGLIWNRESSSYLSIESSYFYKNDCQWLVQNDGMMNIVGCFLDSKTCTGNQVSIEDEVDISEIPMTILASCGLNAEIPYMRQFTVGEKTKGYHLLIMLTLSLVCHLHSQQQIFL